MPIHDWTRVPAGTFHDFHNAWLVEARNVLNAGVLPAGFYAQTEQVAGELNPDVLALQVRAEAESDALMRKKRALLIRHSSGDRIVAFLEIVSRGGRRSWKRRWPDP
jgi:hypothetical protein